MIEATFNAVTPTPIVAEFEAIIPREKTLPVANKSVSITENGEYKVQADADTVMTEVGIEVAIPYKTRYVEFNDSGFAALIAEKFGCNVGVTEEQAAGIDTIPARFARGNAEIKDASGLSKFTNLTSIGSDAFASCTNLTGDLIIPDSVTMMGEWAFYMGFVSGTDRLFINLNTRPLLTTDTHPNSRQPISSTGFKEIYIDDMQALVKSEIPWFYNSVAASLYTWDLYVNGVLTKDIVLDCPETHTVISRILAGSSITSVKFNDGFTNILSMTFDYCRSLSLIDLPSTITSIAIYAFRSIKSNCTIVCRALTPPVLGNQVIFIPSSIYVPDESVEAYKTASVWSAYATKIKPLSEYQE